MVTNQRVSPLQNMAYTHATSARPCSVFVMQQQYCRGMWLHLLCFQLVTWGAGKFSRSPVCMQLSQWLWQLRSHFLCLNSFTLWLLVYKIHLHCTLISLNCLLTTNTTFSVTHKIILKFIDIAQWYHYRIGFHFLCVVFP